VGRHILVRNNESQKTMGQCFNAQKWGNILTTCQTGTLNPEKICLKAAGEIKFFIHTKHRPALQTVLDEIFESRKTPVDVWNHTKEQRNWKICR
jgi:hypothetical protein